MNRFMALAALVLATLTGAAGAQQLRIGQPADLPPFVQQPTNLPGPNQVDIIGDGLGTTFWGGTPPGYANMPANIPTPNASSLITTYDTTLNVNRNFFCGGPVTSAYYCKGAGGEWRAPEPKFRSTLNPCDVWLFDDPVLYPRQPGKSHLHNFIGGCGTNAGSTYASLRNVKNGRSSAGGTDLNRTAYWIAPMCRFNKFGDGRTYCPRMDYVALYYQAGDPIGIKKTVFIPRGLRYITGMSMSDPEDRWIKSKIAAANAANGYERFSYHGNGFGGYICVNNGANIVSINGTSRYPYLATPSGGDPWEGRCKGKSEPGITSAQIEAEFVGPQCWDGVNLWGGPTGTHHVYHPILDAAQNGKEVCFQNNFWIPHLTLKFLWSFSETGEWRFYRLTSDDMAQARLNAEYKARGLVAPVMPNGFSAHTDWFGAWDDDVMRIWERNIGVMGGIDGTSNTDNVLEMNGNTISPTQVMSSVTLTEGNTLTPGAMFRVPNRKRGPMPAHAM